MPDKNSNSIRDEKKRLRLALLKQRIDYRAFWEQYSEKVTKALEVFLSANENLHNDPTQYCTERSEYYPLIKEFSNGLRHFGIGSPLPDGAGRPLDIKTALSALDPFNDEIPEWLPISFSDDQPGIWQVVCGTPSVSWTEAPGEHYSQCIIPNNETLIPLEPSERLLKVDISRRKSELIAEFTTFLDRVKAHRDAFSAGKKMSAEANYAQWEQDNSRYREECWQHLEVWKMRRQRKSFDTIAKEQKMKVPAAKKSFARAFELIEERKYDPALFKKYKEVKIVELKNICDNCHERTTCTEECPDALQYSGQDEVKQHDFITYTPPLDLTVIPKK